MVDSKEESVVFPVILYDGERETNVGSITIHQTFDFKQFQIMLKDTIGISYNNLTTYLVENDKSKIPSERRKILITGKVNFSVLVKERNCYLLVVLKRSRRDRRRKVNKQSGSGLGLGLGLEYSISPEYLIHLRRNMIDMYGYSKENYVNAVQNWNNQLMVPLRALPNGLVICDVGFPGAEEVYSVVQGGRSRALCGDCSKAEKEGAKAGFHFCVYDDVVELGFRSPVGPIARPC